MERLSLLCPQPLDASGWLWGHLVIPGFCPAMGCIYPLRPCVHGNRPGSALSPHTCWNVGCDFLELNLSVTRAQPRAAASPCASVVGHGGQRDPGTAPGAASSLPHGRGGVAGPPCRRCLLCWLVSYSWEDKAASPGRAADGLPEPAPGRAPPVLLSQKCHVFVLRSEEGAVSVFQVRESARALCAGPAGTQSSRNGLGACLKLTGVAGVDTPVLCTEHGAPDGRWAVGSGYFCRDPLPSSPSECPLLWG